MPQNTVPRPGNTTGLLGHRAGCWGGCTPHQSHHSPAKVQSWGQPHGACDIDIGGALRVTHQDIP